MAASTTSLVFDGTNEYVTMGDVAELSFERSDAFSVSVWIRTFGGTGASQTICGKQDASTFRGWSLFLTTGGTLYSFFTSTPGSNDMGASLENTKLDNGMWHHIVMTYDGSSSAAGLKFYVNGSLGKTTVQLNVLSATILNSVAFTVGALPFPSSITRPFLGNIDELAVYNKVLSAAEVTAIYNSGVATTPDSIGPTGNLVGGWAMGDGATYPTIPDLSASGNNGTMSNMESGDIVTQIASDDYARTMELVGARTTPVVEGAGGPSVTDYYRMRGIDSGTSDYTTWVVTGSPDPNGAQATVGNTTPTLVGSINAGSGVILVHWQQ